jgi:hypothetical protein
MIIELGPHKLELKPLEEMSVEELRTECNMWRNMFLNLDDESRYLLWLINREVVIITRRNEALLSIIARVVFAPRYLYLLRTSRRYDPIEGNYKIENVLEKLEYTSVAAIQEVLQLVGVQELSGEIKPAQEEGGEEEEGA